MITEEQQAEYRSAYAADAAEASRLLESFSSDKLLPDKLLKEQLDTIARIRSFLAQAAEARASDLSLAANLARRAAILARELAARYQ
jgi:hypothetical protein